MYMYIQLYMYMYMYTIIMHIILTVIVVNCNDQRSLLFPVHSCVLTTVIIIIHEGNNYT